MRYRLWPHTLVPTTKRQWVPPTATSYYSPPRRLPRRPDSPPPPPGGIWRKQVRLNDLDSLWESRPIGTFHGEPCLVLDDLGDRLHIVYLGMDERRARHLGYWQVARGVFEVVVQRHEVTDLAEERHEFPIALLLSALPRALNAGDGQRRRFHGVGSGVRARFGSSGGRPGLGTAGPGSAGSPCPAAARARARPAAGSRPGTASRPSGLVSCPRPSRSRCHRACSPPPGSSCSPPGRRPSPVGAAVAAVGTSSRCQPSAVAGRPAAAVAAPPAQPSSAQPGPAAAGAVAVNAAEHAAAASAQQPVGRSGRAAANRRPSPSQQAMARPRIGGPGRGRRPRPTTP